MAIFKRREKGTKSNSLAVQTGQNINAPFASLNTLVPMAIDGRIYTALRENIPIIDAAINKIVRLVAGFHFETGNALLDDNINRFFDSINVGGNMTGISSFVDCYLDTLLTYGTAVGEVVLSGNSIYALYNGEPENLEVKRCSNGVDLEFYNGNKKLMYPQRILFSVLNPLPGKIVGTSLLRSLPSIGSILLQIYNTIGENWAHAGNIRYAVTYKPQNDSSEKAFAHERAQQIASAWKDAMTSSSVKDFVAVGDVEVKVIGADSAVLDSEIPVRQMLEEIVAKTGLPPFMLGLSWSTSERMSIQQADILTTELLHYRRILTPVISKIGDMYLASIGKTEKVSVAWDEITLLDETENAKAQLYYAQADKLKSEVEN